MDEFKSEKWTLDDGRRAERRITEHDGERVIELHVEEARPLKLQQRVVERSKPIVYQRQIETVDPTTGEVVEQRIESIEPKVEMKLVDHISTMGQVSAQSVEDDCDCHVTRQELIDTVVTAMKSIKTPAVQPVPANFSDRLNSLGLADEIGTRVNPSKITKGHWTYYLIAVQVVVLVYIVFFMGK